MVIIKFGKVAIAIRTYTYTGQEISSQKNVISTADSARYTNYSLKCIVCKPIVRMFDKI